MFIFKDHLLAWICLPEWAVWASKLELGGLWVCNFFLTFLMMDSSLFQIILNSLGLARWWTADNVPDKVHYDWQECTSMVFPNFDMHHLGKIHQNHWKTTSVNLPSLKAIHLKWAKIQLLKVAKIYRCLYGTNICKTSWLWWVIPLLVFYNAPSSLAMLLI